PGYDPRGYPGDYPPRPGDGRGRPGWGGPGPGPDGLMPPGWEDRRWAGDPAGRRPDFGPADPMMAPGGYPQGGRYPQDHRFPPDGPPPGWADPRWTPDGYAGNGSARYEGDLR